MYQTMGPRAHLLLRGWGGAVVLVPTLDFQLPQEGLDLVGR